MNYLAWGIIFVYAIYCFPCNTLKHTFISNTFILTEIFKNKLVKRKVSLKALNYSKIEKAAGDTVRQVVTLQQGLSSERAKDIVKLVKDMKRKVQSEIQKDQVRVRGKKLDDLQDVINMLKEKDFDFHIEFINYR